jgi:long-chain acyl-CoA synthetase
MAESIIQDYAEIRRMLTDDDGPFALREVDAAGRKVRVYAQAARNLPAIFDQVEASFAGRDLVADAERCWSYAEIFARSRRLAGALQDRFGVRPGDRVGLAMRNRVEWFVSFVAVVRIGGVAVLFNSRSAADELAAAAADVGCLVFIADDKRAEMLRGSDAATPIILIDDALSSAANISLATPFDEVVAEAPRDAEAVDSDPDRPMAILFTSGTTGRAKGAVITHRNLANLAANIQFLNTLGFMLAAKQAGVALDAPGLTTPRVSALLVFPLFHISGLVTFFATMLGGGMMTTIRRWRADDALSLISSNGITVLSGPPQIIGDLLDQPGASEQLASLVHLGAGGQATPPSLVTRIAQALPKTAQGAGWGMTEVVGGASAISGPVFAQRPTSCGQLSPIMELRVVDESGRDVPAGETGEFWLRGSLLMQGYWNAPEATKATFEGDWYKTGDVGFVDAEGFIYVVDRKKDMVISGGENIYCAEVERVLSSDEAFAEAAMFGVPDERLGERAIAAVTLRNGHVRSEEAVKAFVRASLADYKVPSAVVFDLGPFPRNVTGKVDKKKLRAAYLQRLQESATPFPAARSRAAE